MAKDNIIKFPTSEEMKKKQMAEELQKSADMSAEASTECVAMTQEYLNYIEHIIQDGVLSDWRIFEGMEFRNEAYPESKDMYVLVNLFNAMLNILYNIVKNRILYFSRRGRAHRRLSRTRGSSSSGS